MSQFRRSGIAIASPSLLAILLAASLGGCSPGAGSSNLMSVWKSAQAEAPPPPPLALTHATTPAPKPAVKSASKSGEPLVILGPAPAAPDTMPVAALAPVANKPVPAPSPAPDPYALKRVPLGPN